MKKLRLPVNIGLIVTLTILSGWLIYCSATSDQVLGIRHYLGIIFTAITLMSLLYNRNVFTMALFITLTIGNFCGLSSILTITTESFYVGIRGFYIPVYWGQPEYSLLLILYLIFNIGFFTGILTKKYWKDFLTRTNDLELVLTIVNDQDKTKDEESA